MKTHKLMIKTHKKTGLKYLCYTTSEGSTYKNYKGSGKYWKRHLKKHGEDIDTELIFSTECYDEFVREAKAKSAEYDIVQSDEWANLREEDGNGGDTTSNRMWINDGVTDKYAYKTEPIPEGWSRGRSKCVFNDVENQRKFGAMADIEKRGAGIKRAWDSGKFDKRDNSKLGRSGDDNVSKRPEVREKIKAAADLRWSDPKERAKQSDMMKRVKRERHRANKDQ